MVAHPKVSVLTITYNHEKYIAQCIESVLAQRTDFPIELIIGDDFSTDGTRAIVQDYAQRYPDKIHAVLQSQNVGCGKNASTIYHLAQGEYIAYLEGDDYWTDPEKLHKQVSALDANSTWCGCFHPVLYVNDNGQLLNRQHPPQAMSLCTFEDLTKQNSIQTCSAVLRRARLPFLPDWYADLMPGDWPLFLLVAQHGPWGFINEPMAYYRVHSDGIWTGRNFDDKVRAGSEMLLKLSQQLPDPWKTQLIKGRRGFIRKHMLYRVYRMLGLHYILQPVRKWLSR